MKLNPPQVLIIIVSLSFVGVASLKTFQNSQKEVNQNKSVQKQEINAIDAQVPDDFFLTIKPEILPPPIIIKEPEPELEPIILPLPEKLFRYVEPQPIPELTPKEVERRRILRESLFKISNIQEIINLQKEDTLHSGKEYEEIKKSKQKDHKKEGVETTEASYPVDMERILPMIKFIPAVLYTEVDSEIPSDKVIAIVEQDIIGYHGKKILIPRGSKVVGQFQSIVSPDSTRMGIFWYRILTPIGINIQLTGESADVEGASGLSGYVDNKWKEKYGTALLFSSISALTQLSVPTGDESAKAAADAFSEEIGPVVAENLRNAMSIVPRINIPKGERINISPLVDIYFKEPIGGRSTGLPLLSKSINPSI